MTCKYISQEDGSVRCFEEDGGGKLIRERTVDFDTYKEKAHIYQPLNLDAWKRSGLDPLVKCEHCGAYEFISDSVIVWGCHLVCASCFTEAYS